MQQIQDSIVHEAKNPPPGIKHLIEVTKDHGTFFVECKLADRCIVVSTASFQAPIKDGYFSLTMRIENTLTEMLENHLACIRAAERKSHNDI